MGLTRAYRQYQAELEAAPYEKNPAALNNPLDTLGCDAAHP